MRVLFYPRRFILLMPASQRGWYNRDGAIDRLAEIEVDFMQMISPLTVTYRPWLAHHASPVLSDLNTRR